MLLGDSIYLLKNKGKGKKRSKNIGFFQESYDFWGFHSEKVMTFLETSILTHLHTYL